MRNRIALVAFIATTALGLVRSAAAQWNVAVGGNSARNGRSAEIGPTGPNLLWQGSLPGIVAQQGVADGGLVIVNRITSFTIPTGTWIVAHDIDTGAIQWQVQLPMNFPDSWRSRVTGFRDNQVYATRSGNTNAEYLYALSPANGAILWQSQDLIIETTTESVAYAPNGDPITTGRVNGQTVLLRIDRTNGQTVWSTPRTCPTSGGCDAAVFGNHAYAFEAATTSGGPKITVFDVGTGQKLYSSNPITQGFAQQVAPFVGPDGTVYAPRTQNNPVTDVLVAFTDTGTSLVMKWSRPIGYVPFASFAVGPDGSVYSYDSDLKILRLDPSNGAVVDRSPPYAFDFPAQPRMAIDASGKLFVTNGGFGQGRLDVFTPELKLLWSTPIANVNVGGPVLGKDGTLIVCGVGTDVRAYRSACDGYTLPYGGGCAGTGGIVPALSASGCSQAGGTVVIDVKQALGGAFALFLVGLGDGTALIAGTCALQIAPLAPIAAGITLPGAGAGQGSISVPALVPPGTPPADAYLQVLVADPNAPFGVASTNPLRIRVE